VGDNNAILREPPYSDEAELAVITGICWRNDAIDQIADQLSEEHFYRTAHKLVYRTMVALHQKGDTIDLVTLGEALKTSGSLDAIGGLAFLANLLNTATTSASIVSHANVVFEKAMLRRLINAAHNILADAYTPTRDADEIIEDAERAVLEVAEEKIKEGIIPISSIVRDSIKHLEDIAKTGNPVSGVPSGFADLDRMTNGFQKGDLIILAARPAMGKTALALNIAAHASSKYEAHKNVLFFSLEMPRTQLGLRLICSTAEINLSAMRNAQLIEANFDRLTKSAGELYESRLFIDDTGALSLMDIRSKARRMKAEHGLDMVFIDYIQLMEPPKASQNREQEISKISRNLKLLAKEMEIPVIALAQLNRSPEARTDKRPLMSDLRESGALEQDADMIIFIYRDEVYNQERDDNRGKAEIILSKHRNGRTGSIELEFQGQYARFRSVARRDNVPEEYLPEEPGEDFEDVSFP